jgi:hypothetical protein
MSLPIKVASRSKVSCGLSACSVSFKLASWCIAPPRYLPFLSLPRQGMLFSHSRPLSMLQTPPIIGVVNLFKLLYTDLVV